MPLAILKKVLQLPGFEPGFGKEPAKTASHCHCFFKCSVEDFDFFTIIFPQGVENGPGGTAASKDGDPPAGRIQLIVLQGVGKTAPVGVGSKQPPIPDGDGIDRPDMAGGIIQLVQIFKDRFLVGDSNIDAADVKGLETGNCSLHPRRCYREGQVDGINLRQAKDSVMNFR